MPINVHCIFKCFIKPGEAVKKKTIMYTTIADIVEIIV